MKQMKLKTRSRTLTNVTEQLHSFVAVSKGPQKDCFEILHIIFIYILFNEVLLLKILIETSCI